MESTNQGGATVSPWSCFNCRRRKVRCDRLMPCTYCSKGNLDCAFPASGRMPTRRHDLIPIKSGREKQTELLGRIKRLESLVEDLSMQLDGETAKMNSSKHENSAKDRQGLLPRESKSSHLGPTTTEFGRLFTKENGTMYIGNRFWSVLWDEVRIAGPVSISSYHV